jgi:organic hydroperoxide reductase OsmC/OhrA
MTAIAGKTKNGDLSANILIDCGLPLIFKTSKTLPLPAISSTKKEFVRTYVNSLTVFQKEAIVTSRRAGQTWRLASDEGKYLRGNDAAPAPLTYLTIGMVSSFMNEIIALAKLRRITLNTIVLIQDNFYSMKGSMNLGTMLAGAEDVHIEAKIDSPSDQVTLQGLVTDAIAASPMGALMRDQKTNLFTLTHNGKSIAPKTVPELDSQLIGADHAGKIEMAQGDWAHILTRGALTPKNENTNSFTGSSLANHQNRLLHLRGICTLREDGVKVIEQQLFNPHGSIYYFLSDESPQDGGKALAPNAATYISAGIGFCFMTQFGRFAKMKHSKLRAYSIVQDAHSTVGGASGSTGKPGDFSPLETHVFLESDEDDDFARHILEVSERTCFLHAFCRTSIKAKVKVSRL